MNPLKRLVRLMTAALLLTCAASAQQGEGPLNPAPPKGITPEQIVQKVAENEAAFKQAWEKYTYRQDIKAQTLDGKTVNGEYRLVQDVLFDDQGRRIEKVLFAPQSTLRVEMTREDHNDLRNLMGFVFTPEELPEYNVLYVGQQRVDELETYVFDVAPKKIEKDRRYFQGRVWVDQQDLQAVKTHGRAVPDIRRGKGNENLFPEFTSYREQIDKQYWFPTYVRADDTLNFSTGDVDIRIIVKYENYKRFGSDVKIVYEGEEVPRTPEAKPQEQQPK